jgi:hypothetical protein
MNDTDSQTPDASARPGFPVPHGSALFLRAIVPADGLMVKVWQGTPWVVEAYTGGFDDPRSREIQDWCRDAFGPEAHPIHGMAGNWHRGGATINGYTWLGFATEKMMNAFEAAWPNQ